MKLPPINPSSDLGSPQNPLLAGMRIRQAVEADLREMEWEGSYKRYRRVYQEVFELV